MADINEYKKMLHAYALGCLEHQDHIELNSYLKAGGEFDRSELWEYQNLASLIAVSLEEKIPHPKVKDSVARRLYRMSEEIKAKRAEEIKPAEPKKENPPPPQIKAPFIPLPMDEEELINKDTIKFRFEEEQKQKEEKRQAEEKLKEKTGKSKNEDLENKLDDIFRESIDEHDIEESTEQDADTIPAERDYAAVDGDVFMDTSTSVSEETAEENIQEKPSNFEVVIPLSQSQSAAEEKDDLHSHAVSHDFNYGYGEKSGKKNIGIIFLLIFLTILFAAAAVYFYLKYQNEIDDSNQQLGRLNSEISMLNERIANRDEARLVLEQGDAEIVNLNPVENENFNAKLYVSFSSNKGYIYLGKMPDLPPNQSYQLWIQIKGSHYSLGAFHPDSVFEYYPFKIPSIENKKGVLFLVSREKQQGSKIPSSNVLLRGMSSQ